MMWIVILLLVLGVCIAGAIYMTGTIGKFGLIKKLSKDRKGMRRLLSFGVIVVFFAIFILTMSVVNAIIIFLHLIIFRLLFGLIFLIIKKIRKREFKIYWQGWISIIVCTVYLIIGYILCNNVWMTKYELTTDKKVGNLRIAMFADSHLGTTFDADGLKKWVDEIMEYSPDILLIPGDLIDDGTSREDMIKCCEILGNANVKYGVWFSYGNHDRGYYRDEKKYFSEAEFEENMEKNGVHILTDKWTIIDGRFILVGREDKSRDGRAEISDLMKEVDNDKYIIVMDHQPSDYDNEAATAADLVVSGHTHGGQFFPITRVGEYIGVNDRTYGYEKRNGTEFIVTSGISDWALYFKTGTKSEYVIIDIEGR